MSRSGHLWSTLARVVTRLVGGIIGVSVYCLVKDAETVGGCILYSLFVLAPALASQLVVELYESPRSVQSYVAFAVVVCGIVVLTIPAAAGRVSAEAQPYARFAILIFAIAALGSLAADCIHRGCERLSRRKRSAS